MTRMDPSQIGRPAGGTAPAPQGGDVPPIANARRPVTAWRSDGYLMLSVHDRHTQPVDAWQYSLRRAAEELNKTKWLGLAADVDVIAEHLPAMVAALAQPPRPAAVADEDVYGRSAEYWDCPCGNWLHYTDLLCRCGRSRTEGTPIMRGVPIASPAPRDPARDAEEAEDDPRKVYAHWGQPMDFLRGMIPLLPPIERERAELALDALAAGRMACRYNARLPRDQALVAIHQRDGERLAVIADWWDALVTYNPAVNLPKAGEFSATIRRIARALIVDAEGGR